MDTENTAHEQAREELIEELEADLPVAIKLRDFAEETGGIWALETLKRIDYPEGIRFRSGKNYIYRTRALLRYLLSRDFRQSGN